MMVIAHRVLLSCISPSLQLMGLWLILWVVAPCGYCCPRAWGVWWI